MGDYVSQTTNEMIIDLVEKYVLLQRVKANNEGPNTFLDDEIRKCRIELRCLGVNTDELTIQ